MKLNRRYYLWMELQLSSYDELSAGKKSNVLELSAVLTDSDFQILSRFSTPILEQGNHPGTVRLITDPVLRHGYDEAGLWDAMADGMGIAAADIFLRDSLSTAIEDYKIPEGTLFTVVCRRAYLTSQIIKRDMPELVGRLSNDFVDVDTVKTFMETFMEDSMTHEELDFLFRPNTYNADRNVTSNMEAMALIMSKTAGREVPELMTKKGRRAL